MQNRYTMSYLVIIVKHVIYWCLLCVLVLFESYGETFRAFLYKFCREVAPLVPSNWSRISCIKHIFMSINKWFKWLQILRCHMYRCQLLKKYKLLHSRLLAQTCRYIHYRCHKYLHKQIFRQWKGWMFFVNKHSELSAHSIHVSHEGTTLKYCEQLILSSMHSRKL